MKNNKFYKIKCPHCGKEVLSQKNKKWKKCINCKKRIIITGNVISLVQLF